MIDTKGDKAAAKDTKDEEEEASPDEIPIGSIKRLAARRWRRKEATPGLANNKHIAFYIEQERSVVPGRLAHGTAGASTNAVKPHDKVQDIVPNPATLSPNWPSTLVPS